MSVSVIIENQIWIEHDLLLKQKQISYLQAFIDTLQRFIWVRNEYIAYNLAISLAVIG